MSRAVADRKNCASRTQPRLRPETFARRRHAPLTLLLLAHVRVPFVDWFSWQLMVDQAERWTGLRARRQTQAKGATSAGRGIDAEFAVQKFSEPARDRQPEPRAVLQLCFSKLHKLVED